MVDEQGHARVTDFGLAKQGVKAVKPGDDGCTYSLVGTPEYLAPEQVRNQGHGKAVDWWTVGQLMYEMLCGQCAYSHQDMSKLNDMILSQDIRYPSSWLSDAGTSLLC